MNACSFLKLALAAALALTASTTCAAPPFPGSTVYIPELATLTKPTPAVSTIVLRLPPQAGIVTHVITTNLLKTGTSWLAKGNKYWSLCAPRRNTVACTPITLTSTMRDIDIRAYAGDNNAAFVAYDVNPATTRSAGELVLATEFFQKQLAAKVARFSQYSPGDLNWQDNKTKAKPLGAATKPRPIAPSGWGCLYEDDQSIDCITGNNDGEPVDEGEYDWSYEEEGEYVEWYDIDPPAFEEIPTYPPSEENGDQNPCIGPDGSNICQVVVIMGERPPSNGCVYSPFGSVCTIAPPPIIGDNPIPAPVPKPWFSQETCNLIHALCNKNQEPEVENERVPAQGDTYEDKVAACELNRDVDEGMCEGQQADYRVKRACYERARERFASCLTTARNTSGIKK